MSTVESIEDRFCNIPEAPEYYMSLDSEEISSQFKDFDDSFGFRILDERLRRAQSRNFVLDFGDDAAWCAFDLNTDAVSKLLRSKRPASLHTRWINIWLPDQQRELLTDIAKYYDWSPRLLGLMCSPPIKRASKSLSTPQSGSGILHWSSGRSARSKTSSDFSAALEEKVGLDGLPKVRDQELNHYTLASEVLHWSTVDFGRKYVSVGYNTLHDVSSSSVRQPFSSTRDVPPGKRVWTWLIYCEEKTVIAVHEDPFPFRDAALDPHELHALTMVRRNLTNVFRQCSKAHDSSLDIPLMQLPIRKRVGDSMEEAAHSATDAPGLLFYSLFDDWLTSYGLIGRRQYCYADELNRLREEMLTRASLAHVSHLHALGRQLSALKRLYVSYESIVERILYKQEISLASLKNSNVLGSGLDSPALQVSTAMVDSGNLMGVAMSSAARVRFERLKDMIRLYALREINENLELKEGLMVMNFNLIAIKESYSVEQLTRTTLFVAKLTMLFMPVSLMTAYFSCALEDVTFSSRGYWTAFGVVLGLSFVVLFLFSWISGTLDGRMFYVPWTQRLWLWLEGMVCRKEPPDSRD
ncbi:hypothetical protein P152DRAFT_412628 [Eremomyces bilateralis CBS 781.70]|uniref:ADP-ribosylation factor n=1 Tax=Eremomyces bilateralis CBS 781.70 TaxID=1392243 RepID=A0A6G1G8D6_9PEZI|nr:uncharacterized protein P152DRAFT_412628 [Eremomyces bilateralis CBS 781.70]KAF1814119.1 hypothetical protein P152DRAFT_412628 [Eremomyces bilateralis CBS 781.70]